MSDKREFDLRKAINAISDVIQNRPRPLRNVDQIYMKAADMVLQSEWVANWAQDKSLAFIGDGDAISVCVAYLHARGILPYGPRQITVFDFDERICGAVNRFAEKEKIETLSAQLYNCIDAFPAVGGFECFYTNPPWGASNEGASVHVFTERGMEAVGYTGEGVIVIADDHDLPWPQRVLATTQKYILERNFYVQRMASQMHSYHLDDAPDLKSCNLVIKALPCDIAPTVTSTSITDRQRLDNFYGMDQPARIRYIKEVKRIDYGRAPDDEYRYELIDEVPA